MARLIRTSNATDPATGKTIQHSLWDEGYAYVIYRWDEETDKTEFIDETRYEGIADRKAARYLALGEMSSQHHLALYEVHGSSFVGKHGITWRWSEQLMRFVTSPKDSK